MKSLIARRERGSAIIEFIFLGILLLIPLVFIMLTAFHVQSSAYAASAASRAGSRAYVLAGSNGRSATAAMNTAVDLALDDQGVRAHALPPQISCSAPGCLQPGSSVTVTVIVNVPLPLPDFMRSWTSKSAVAVRSSQTTPYGDYRAPG
jgi:Flp pilus assembly protein TadG